MVIIEANFNMMAIYIIQLQIQIRFHIQISKFDNIISIYVLRQISKSV